MRTTRSNNWKYQIQIKDRFEDESSPELIIELCNRLVLQLDVVLANIEKDLLEEDIDRVWQELEVERDNFEHLRNLVDGTIPEDEWDDYGYDGDYETEFNNYFNQLYDVGDTRVVTKQNVSEKFIWIN